MVVKQKPPGVAQKLVPLAAVGEHIGGTRSVASEDQAFGHDGAWPSSGGAGIVGRLPIFMMHGWPWDHDELLKK